MDLLAQGLWLCLVPTDSRGHAAPPSDKEISLCLHPPCRGPVHERDTSQGAGVAKVLMGAGQGMSAIADIVLKHALSNMPMNNLQELKERREPFVTALEQRLVCEPQSNTDPTSISCRCFFRHTDNAQLQGFFPCEENGI